MRWSTLILFVPVVYFVVVLVVLFVKKIYFSGPILRGNPYDYGRYGSIREETLLHHGVITVVILLVALIVTGVSYAVPLFVWLVHRTNLKVAQLGVATLVASVGAVAHRFKIWNKRLYAVVEILVGFWSAVFVAGTLQPGVVELAKWSTLAGAAYFIARGAGNYHDENERLRQLAQNKVQPETSPKSGAELMKASDNPS
jgi:hypothetical protein